MTSSTASPEIPHGFATQLGKAGTLVLTLATLLTTVLEGNHQGETKYLATLATIVGVATIVGRMLQSAAALYGGAGGYAPDVGDAGPRGARARPPA